jgi:hypothetical protein
LLLGKFCKAILAFARRLNPLLTGVVIEAALSTVCLSRRAQVQVNITGTSWVLGRENNLDQQLVISALNGPDTAILPRGVRLLAGILALLILAFCFFASWICITVILAAFLPILVDPVVRALEKLRIPRFLAAGLIVLTGVLACGFFIYKSYDKLTDFSDEFPPYMSRSRTRFLPSAAKSSEYKTPQESWSMRLRRRRLRIYRYDRLLRGPAILFAEWVQSGNYHRWGRAVSGVFHATSSRQNLFLPEDNFGQKTTRRRSNRKPVDWHGAKLRRRKSGDRDYVVGNQYSGVLVARIDASRKLGLISGALNLIPFLGIIVALAVPMMAGVFQFHSAGPFAVIGVTVI